MNKKQREKSPKKIYGFLSNIILITSIICAVSAGICDGAIPDSVTLRIGDSDKISRWLGEETIAAGSFDNEKDIYTAKSQNKLFGCIPIKETSVSVIGDIELIPGGVPFGVKIYSEGIIVVGIGDVNCGNVSVSPAREAGIMEKDLISAVDGAKLRNAEELTSAVNESGGRPMKFTVKRGETELTLTVTPVISEEDGKYKTGMLIRDSTAGIGTVTYIDKEHNSFAGLGHGICDLDTGELLPLTRGNVFNATISGIIKGQSGTPGELQGYFSSGKIGNLTGNNECGVYGILTELPANMEVGERDIVPLKVALSDEIKAGEAEILCTVDNSGVGQYKVEISDIEHSGKNVKNFVVTVTDERLLSQTGGIVQGMSGSPIIQNGKLVGAVTHVCVNL